MRSTNAQEFYYLNLASIPIFLASSLPLASKSGQLAHFCAKCLLIFFVWVGTCSVRAEVFWLEEQSLKVADQDITYLEDLLGSLEVAQVRQLWKQQNFKVLEKTGASFGWVDNPYWFALTVVNGEPTQQKLLLEVAWPLLDDIRVFGFDAQDNRVLEYRSGDKMPFRERAINDTNFVFPVTLPAASSVELLFRVHTTSSLQLPIRLWKEKDFNVSRSNFLIGQGLFYGMLLVMIVYNLFIYLSVKRNAYLYYVLFVISFVILQASLKGLAFQFLWPNNTFLTDYGVATGGGFCLLFLSLFARSFLRLDAANTRLRHVNSALNAVAILLILASLLLPYYLVIKTLAFAVIFGSFTLIATAIYRYQQGYKEARFYLLAWAAMVLGSTLYLLKQFGIFPVMFITEYGLQIGSTLEVVLLSLALADRLNTMRSKLELANQLLSEQNQTLEKEVNHRTQELVGALNELATVNEKLSEMSVTDKLTGFKNRNYFDEKLADMLSKNSETRLPLSLIIFDIDHFKQVNDQYGHVAGDKSLVAIADCIRNEVNNESYVVCRFGGEEFVILMPETDQLGAAILAESIRIAVEGIELYEQKSAIRFSISVGIATTSKIKYMGGELLLKAADAALYNAKEDGRNCVHISTYEPNKDNVEPELTSSRYGFRMVTG